MPFDWSTQCLGAIYAAAVCIGRYPFCRFWLGQIEKFGVCVCVFFSAFNWSIARLILACIILKICESTSNMCSTYGMYSRWRVSFNSLFKQIYWWFRAIDLRWWFCVFAFNLTLVVFVSISCNNLTITQLCLWINECYLIRTSAEQKQILLSNGTHFQSKKKKETFITTILSTWAFLLEANSKYCPLTALCGDFSLSMQTELVTTERIYDCKMRRIQYRRWCGFYFSIIQMRQTDRVSISLRSHVTAHTCLDFYYFCYAVLVASVSHRVS